MDNAQIQQEVRREIDRLLPDLLESVGAHVRREFDRAAKQQKAEIIFARVVITATPAQVTAAGKGSVNTVTSTTGPNGSQTLVYVVMDDNPNSNSLALLPVRPGVTLAGAGGEWVRIVKNSLDATWAAGMIDCKP